MTDEADRPYLILEVVRIVETLKDQKKPLFKKVQWLSRRHTGALNPLFSVQGNRLGERILQCLQQNLHTIPWYYPDHKLHPYAVIFCAEAQERDMSFLHTPLEYLNPTQATYVTDILNGFVEAIHGKVRTEKVDREVKDHRRSSDKNFREYKKYLRKVLGPPGSSIVERYDFAYVKPDGWPLIPPELAYETVKGHRDQLIKFLSTKLPKASLRGYIWKLEYSAAKSFQHHFLLVFARDSPDIQNMYHIVKQHWEEALTGSQGIAYNCRDYYISYKSAGIGANPPDEYGEMPLVLRNALLYLTKPEYLVKFKPPGNGRTLGRGCIDESVQRPAHVSSINSMPFPASPVYPSDSLANGGWQLV